jgi:hypothetical protein
VAKVGVSIALLAYLFATTDLRALARRVAAGDPGPLALAMAVHGCVFALSLWRWRVLLRAQDYPAPVARLSGSYLVATFFNNFLPGNIGGDVVRVRDSRGLTGSTTASLAVVAVDRILGLGALYALAVTAFLLGGDDVRRLMGAAPALLALGAAFAALAYVFFRPGIARRLMALARLDRLPWVRERFETAQAAVHVYRRRIGAVVGALSLSVGIQVLVVAYHYNVARALRIPLALSAALLVVPLCTLVQTVPVSFNGWGVRETVFIIYFTQLGLGRDSALAFSIVGAGLITLLSLSGALVWLARGRADGGSAQPDPVVDLR